MSLKPISALASVVGLLLAPAGAWACSVMGGPAPGIQLVHEADLIIRAKAVEYARPPSDPNTFTTGVPGSEVRFARLEAIRGPGASELVLPGYLVDYDDFNDQKPPYNFVRPGGRAGSCFANSYKRGAEYLLFLKKTKTGALTVNWAALAAVNEQLHSSDDPWLLWVREQARTVDKSHGKK